jgi:hypothetical protein
VTVLRATLVGPLRDQIQRVTEIKRSPADVL